MTTYLKTSITSVIFLFILFSTPTFAWKIHLSPEQVIRLCGVPIDTVQMKMLLAKEDSLNKVYQSQSKSLVVPLTPNWRYMMGPVANQDTDYWYKGDCYAHAVAGVVEGQLHISKNSNIGIFLNASYLAFESTGGDKTIGDPKYPLDYIKTLKTPSYIIGSPGNYPNLSMIRWGILSYYSLDGVRVHGVDSIKHYLNYGPITACFYVHPDFEPFFENHPTGVYVWDQKPDTGLFPRGHAVVIVSFNDIDSCWICKNSWGINWADSGYFRIHYNNCGINSWENCCVTVDQSCYGKIVPNLINSLNTACSYGFLGGEGAQVLSNVIVDNGNTLTVPPKAKIAFGNGVSLIINGTLNAQGTSAKPIRFTSATGSPSVYWNCVQVNNGNSVFKYCTFEYGTYGLYLLNATTGTQTDIENCVFQNNSYYGLRLNGSYALVKSCEMKNNQSYGVYCYGNPDIKFVGDSIHNNTYHGIRSFSNNLLEFFGTVIQSNGNCGIYTNNTDHIRLGRPYNWYGYNTIRYNNSQEIWAGGGSGNAFVEICYSSMHDMTPYELYNDPSNTQPIVASYCFFGTDGCQYSGSVSLDQVQNSIPTWDGQPRTSGSPLGKESTLSIPDSVPWIFDTRISDAEKVKRCKAIIAKNSSAEESKTALEWMYSIIRADYMSNELNEKDSFFEYLQNLNSNYANTNVGKLALRYMFFWKMLNEDYTSAIQYAQEALNNYNGEEKKWVLVDLAFAHSHNGQKTEAKNDLKELVNNYTLEQRLIRDIENDIADAYTPIKKVQSQTYNQAKPSEMSIGGLPISYDLSQNFPNPFNPTTIFKYHLPNIGTQFVVSLQVYDILGRLVATLTDGIKDAGYYSVTFDGSHFASGIYFTRINVIPQDGSAPYTKTIKILLTK